MKKPYPATKPSGVEWLGEIPEHWDRARLKHEFSEKEKVANPTLQCGSISFGVVVYKDSERVPEETKRAYQEVLKDEFLINPLNMNYDLKSLRTALSTLDVIVSSGYIVLKSYAETDKQFLRWFLYVFDIRHMKTLGSGIRQTITFKDIGNCWFYLPSLSEQQQIARYLDRETGRIDGLVLEKQRFVELLKEKRQALISHVVTKGLPMVGSQKPAVKMKDSGIDWIGEVPEHWVVCRLKHRTDFQSGVPKGRLLDKEIAISVPYLRVANVQDGHLNLKDVAEIEIKRTELSRYSLRPGDVLMNEGGDNDKLGRGAVWHGEISPCIHQNHVFAIRPTSISSEWLSIFTQSSSAKFYFFRVSKQSTNLASISSSNIKDAKILCPPSDEQQKLVDWLKIELGRIDELVAEVGRSIELLKEERTALISAAVTGKIDVRG